jgi:hypothetical protein
MISSLILFGAIVTGVTNFITSDGGTEYAFTCREYDGELSTGYNMKEDWLLSDEINGYEDIPENEKKNMSNETIESLKSLSKKSFTSLNYTELTEEQRGNVVKAVNREAVYISSRNATPPSGVINSYQDIFYRGKMYICGEEKLRGGA